MNSKEHYKNLNNKFISYWSKKRNKRFKFTFINTSIFALPLSIVLAITNYGFNKLFSFKSVTLTLITFCIYGCFVYFVEYKINENRYQKLIKEEQSFDN